MPLKLEVHKRYWTTLKISLEKKSRQIQAESSDFILNPDRGDILFQILMSFQPKEKTEL